MKNKTFNLVSPLLAAVLGVALIGCKVSDTSTLTGSTMAVSPEPKAETKPNNAWISLSGKVVATAPDAFSLDYGSGVMTVEMDDWDWYPEGRALLLDDDVVVYGYVDDDFLEQRTIEASSVYVKNLGTQFYASGVDEEDLDVAVVVSDRPRIELTGTIKDTRLDEFTLITGSGSIEFDVNIEQMPYNPLDDEGFQKLAAGDRVRVRGALGYELFNDLDLMADAVITLDAADTASAG